MYVDLVDFCGHSSGLPPPPIVSEVDESAPLFTLGIGGREGSHELETPEALAIQREFLTACEISQMCQAFGMI